MIDSILVATDASPASKRAIALAADMSARYGATLHILHVVRDMQLPPQLRKLAEVEKIAGERADVLVFVGEQILREAAERARKKGVKDVHTAVARGDPAGAIIKYARRRKLDLVVLGTRGLGKVRGVLMGSVSRKVANLCDVSCLIVR